MPKTTDSQPEHLYTREIPSPGVGGGDEVGKNQVISFLLVVGGGYLV